MASIEIAVDIKRITDKAVLANDGARDAWIPRSQITDYTDEIVVGESITIFVPQWLAEEKGLI